MRKIMYFVNLAIAAQLAYWIAGKWDTGDLLFIVPHVIFAILLVAAAVAGFVNPRLGQPLTIAAYATMLAWAVSLIVYIAVANPRDGEHLGLYAVILGVVAFAFLSISVAAARRRALTPS
jgi:hypothetical protein